MMPSVAAYESQKAQSIAQIGQAIGGAVDKIEQDRIKEETRQVNLAMMRSQAEMETMLNKPSYEAAEIPEGIEVRRTDKQIIDGVEQSVDRVDIPAFEVKAKIYQQEMTKKVMAEAEKISNEKARSQWLEDKLALIDVQTQKLTANAEADQREYNEQVLNNDINEALGNEEFDVALVLAGDIKNAQARSDAKKLINKTKELTTYDSLILQKDSPESWVAIEQSIELLRDPEQKSTLTTEQRNSEAVKLESALKQGKQDFLIAQKSAIADNAADIKVDLNRGSVNYTEEQFKKDRDSGLLTNEQYIGYTKQLEANKKALEESQKSKFEIQSGYINPKNKNHMKAVDDEFTALAQNSNPWQATQQIVQKYNVLPPAVNNAFNMANITGGGNLTSAALQYNLLNETNPVAMMNVKAERVQQVAAYIELGMRPTEALEALVFNESLSAAQIETKKAMFTGAENIEDSANALNNLFTESYGKSWYEFDGGTPDMPVFMSAEFTALTEANLAKTGFNLDVARKMAFNSIKGKYVPTDINGSNQLLPYMPQQPSELVRKQITKQLGEDVIIQSDQFTENQFMTGAPLTYMAYKDLGDGNIEMLERFKYDPQEIQIQQVKEQEAKQKAREEQILKEREKSEYKKDLKKRLRTAQEKRFKDNPLMKNFKEDLGL
jgi:hypothetical protein